MRYTTISITALASAILVTACASMPETIPELEQARTEVQTLTQDPMAQQEASRELESARTSLQQAEAALKEGERDEVIHYAYLASQKAKTGQERIIEARARELVAQGEAERNRVLLEARTREARAATESAQEQAALARSRAEQVEVAQMQAQQAQEQLAQLQAEQTERGMVLTLDDVLFDTAQATLKPGANLELDRVATFLKQNEDVKVLIEGHTDSRGPEQYNLDLSQRRALAVADALAFRGISRDRFEAVGRGEALPVASNETSAGQQQNRRVELVFSDQAGRFASGVSTSLR